MSDQKTNMNAERILAFKLAKELRPQELTAVSGALGSVAKNFTYGWQTAPTRPEVGSYDQNDYVVDSPND